MHFTQIFRNAVVLFEGILLNLCFKLLARRYLYTVHNVLPHNKENSSVFHLVYCLIYHIPDRLVVHSYLAKEQLIRQFSVPPEKISVISIGINEEISVTPLTGKDARRRLGYEDEAQLVLFFGRIDEYKGLDVLINAFDQLELPTTKLLIAGAFNTKAYRRQIRAAIAAARRRTDIRLDERSIPDAEVEVFFKACDVLVLPYRNIYQSGVIFLCFNFGMPIVATDVGSFREFIEENLGIITKTQRCRWHRGWNPLFLRDAKPFRSRLHSHPNQKVSMGQRLQSPHPPV